MFIGCMPHLLLATHTHTHTLPTPHATHLPYPAHTAHLLLLLACCCTTHHHPSCFSPVPLLVFLDPGSPPAMPLPRTTSSPPGVHTPAHPHQTSDIRVDANCLLDGWLGGTGTGTGDLLNWWTAWIKQLTWLRGMAGGMTDITGICPCRAAPHNRRATSIDAPGRARRNGRLEKATFIQAWCRCAPRDGE